LIGAAFVLLGCALIPTLGVQHDEALFAMAVWTPQSLGSFDIAGVRVPAMLMSYVGADKGYLYRTIFSVFEPNVWSVRLPVLFIGAVTIVLFVLTLERFVPVWAAAAGGALLATDPMFLITTTFDWGPLALQHLYIVGGLFLVTRTPPRVFAAFLCFGLAMWDKAVAVWVLVALAGAALWQVQVTGRRVALAVGGLTIGGLPLWLYNVQNGFRTFRENSTLSTELIGYKAGQLLECLNGTALVGWMFRGPHPGFVTLTLPLLVVAVVAGRRRGAMWFGAVTAALVVAQMLVVKNAGFGAQHILLVWPWVHWAIACGLAAVSWSRAARGMAIAGVLANLLLVGMYIRNGWTAGGTPIWSDAIVTAAREIRPEPGETVLAGDWGIMWPLVLLTNGRVTVEGDTQKYARHLFVSHVDGQEAIPGANARWDAKAAARGLRRQQVATWRDRHGRPTIVAFRYRPLN
jgi:hypothetical protein